MPTKEQMMYDMIEETRDDVKAINKRLVGNGQTGLITRVDRIEQGAKRQTKLMLIFLTMAVGVIGTYVASRFKGQG